MGDGRWAMGDVWDALRARVRLFGGARSGYSQVNSDGHRQQFHGQ
jgi:hypothetical protein